jgi:putative transposase
VRRWVLKFGPVIGRQLRRRRAQPSNRWHVDEMAVRIAGKLWPGTLDFEVAEFK